MTKVVDLDARRAEWHTYACKCAACGHVWQGVLHTDRMTGLECSACGKMEGACDPVEVAARYLYWRSSAWENANLLDTNTETQRHWRRMATGIFDFLNRAGFRMSANGDNAGMSARGDMVMVPRVPTVAILEAMCGNMTWKQGEDAYAKMLAAAQEKQG